MTKHPFKHSACKTESWLDSGLSLEINHIFSTLPSDCFQLVSDHPTSSPANYKHIGISGERARQKDRNKEDMLAIHVCNLHLPCSSNKSSEISMCMNADRQWMPNTAAL